MNQITNNASFKAWINSIHEITGKPKKNIFKNVAELTNCNPKTVERWHYGTTKLTAGNAALIQAARERGEI
jgi:hypothetical protein